MGLADLQKIYKEKERLCLLAQGRREGLQKDLDKLKSRQGDIEHNLALYSKANELLQIISGVIQTKTKDYFGDLVTKALRAVFEKEYTFDIDFRISRNKLEAKFIVEDEGFKGDPRRAKGGGITELIGESLRMAVLQRYTPKIDGPILLDERFKNISEEYKSAIGYLLKKMSRNFGRQFIFVSHDAIFEEYADNVINL